MATLTVPWTARPWIERLARAGYVAKGSVYILIGVLALQAAAGAGGRTTGTAGVFQVILHQPFGRWLLWLIAVGLAGYALWRFICAAIDPERRGGQGWRRAAVRVGYAGTAIIHAGLAWQAVRLALGQGGGGEDGQAESRTAQLLEAPFGAWLVGIGGDRHRGLWCGTARQRLPTGCGEAPASRHARAGRAPDRACARRGPA